MSDEVLVSIISTLGIIAVAWLTQWGARKAIRRRRGRKMALQEQADAALADYENNPGAFVQRVLEDNRQKYAEIQGLADELKALRDDMNREVSRLNDEVRDLRDADTKFRGALTRWLRDVFWSWGKAADMPRPSPADEAILRSVLPWGTT